MKPQDTRVWRKNRRAWKRMAKGRRSTHKVRTEPPRRGSTWLRRHPDWDAYAYYREAAK